MSWEREVEGIERRRKLAAEHGGAEAVAKQHELGRLTIRERIAALVDAGSFREQGPIAGQSETDENGDTSYFHFDALGSARALSSIAVLSSVLRPSLKRLGIYLFECASRLLL